MLGAIFLAGNVGIKAVLSQENNNSQQNIEMSNRGRGGFMQRGFQQYGGYGYQQYGVYYNQEYWYFQGYGNQGGYGGYQQQGGFQSGGFRGDKRGRSCLKC